MSDKEKNKTSNDDTPDILTAEEMFDVLRARMADASMAALQDIEDLCNETNKGFTLDALAEAVGQFYARCAFSAMTSALNEVDAPLNQVKAQVFKAAAMVHNEFAATGVQITMETLDDLDKAHQMPRN